MFLCELKTTDEVNAKLNRLTEEDPASFDSWTSTRWDKGVEKLPESVDWRQYGLVSPVQNQVSEEDRRRERETPAVHDQLLKGVVKVHPPDVLTCTHTHTHPH